ncbi:MAG: sigma-70 family RNA polymerase sigma factor [Blastochloris sp.]|nr:sigma-70 family RNA polymerase sigma factor [Blastochloris sp.]
MIFLFSSAVLMSGARVRHDIGLTICLAGALALHVEAVARRAGWLHLASGLVMGLGMFSHYHAAGFGIALFLGLYVTRYLSRLRNGLGWRPELSTILFMLGGALLLFLFGLTEGQHIGFTQPLVLAMIKRMKLHDFDFADLISEGNLALLRAIDKFDVTRGFKFSTYACRAIIKAFSRFATRRGKRKQIFPVEFDPEMEKSDHVERKNAQVEAESVEELRQILRTNAADLSPMEQEILTQRFAVNLENPAINTPTDQTGPLTLNQVGALIGLTKERVRQIQNKAMEKLRAALQERALA